MHAPAAALVLFSLRQGKVHACPAVQECTAQRLVSLSKLESAQLVRTPEGLHRLRLALLVMWGISRIKRVRARACPVTQAHSAAALVSRLSLVCALQDRSRLVVPARLPARPALQASTAQLRVCQPALIALPVLSQRDLLRPLLVPRVLLGFTVPQLASRHASPALQASTAQLRV